MVIVQKKAAAVLNPDPVLYLIFMENKAVSASVLFDIQSSETLSARCGCSSAVNTATEHAGQHNIRGGCKRIFNA